MFTIEDLKLGKCAVVNDGTVEELRKVLKLAFPNDRSGVCGETIYYFRGENNTDWSCSRNIHLPTQSVKDFLKQLDTMENKELKRGDLVWVSDNNPDERNIKVIFLAKIEGAKYPYIVVVLSDESSYRNGEEFVTSAYKYATKIEEPKEVVMTVEEIEKALNIKNLKIVK